jgi:GNAT superfamily N-acetyltransferase
MAASAMETVPLSTDNWPDFVALMGGLGGGCGGCWCTWWRIPRSTWTRSSKDGRREMFRRAVEAGPPPGIVLYQGREPIGWCAVAPRSEYPTLDRSVVAYPIDGLESWCISCIFVRASHRRRGLMTRLILEATDYAFRNDAPAVDAFPQRSGRSGFVERFVGVEGSFLRAGFQVVEPRGENRLAVRRLPRDKQL